MAIADLTPYLQPLERAPRMLRAVVAGQPDGWLDSQHAPDVFSPRRAVAHLVGCEMDPWPNRVRWVMNPEFSFEEGPPSSELLAKHTLPELLDMFETWRARAIQDLVSLNLTEADLEHETTSDTLGVYRVKNLLACWVCHDLYHLGQIFKSYSAQYVDEIGVWNQHLNLPHFH